MWKWPITLHRGKSICQIKMLLKPFSNMSLWPSQKHQMQICLSTSGSYLKLFRYEFQLVTQRGTTALQFSM